VIVGGLGTAGATVALASFAVSAFANAANPTSASSTMKVNADKTVSVTVSGTWSWGELAGVQTSPQKDCAGRSGVGWSVDWWGMSNSPTPTAGKGPTTGSLVNPATSKTTPPSLTSGSLSVAGTWQVKSGPSQGQFFHTSHLFNGFLADLCKNATPTPTGPIGDYKATALYPNIDAVPAKICVNFYDPHGSQGSYSTSAGDNFADQAGDNSIKTNRFDPTLVTGNCSVPVLINPSIKVDKTNDANGDGTFTPSPTNGTIESETAKTVGQDVKFQVVVTNTSSTTLDLDQATDSYGANNVTVCTGTAGPKETQDSGWNKTTLAPGESATCTFTLANYAPASGSTDDTVTVDAHEDGNPGNKTSDADQSRVNAPNPPPTLAAHIRLCSDNSLVPGGALVGTGPAGATLPNGAADFATTVEPAGNYSITATAPNGFVLVNCPSHNFTKTSTLTATLPPSAVLNFYVAPAPGLHVTKDGPVSGVVGGTGDYTITATNTSNQVDLAGPIVFYDQLPTGESYLSAVQVKANGDPTKTNQITCATVAGNASLVRCTYPNDLAPGESIHVDITIQWATDVQGQALTDCAGTTPANAQRNVAAADACVTTHFPALGVMKTGPSVGLLNGNGTYKLVVTNNSSVDSTATEITDTLPDGESFVSATPGGCTASGQIVTCPVGALAKNGGSTTFFVTVTYTKTGSLTDCATIAGQPVPSCKTTDVTKPSITVVKTNDADGDGTFHDSEAAKAAGDAVTFKVVVSNTSKATIVIDSVSDAFDTTTLAECPQLLTVVLESGESATCTFTVANYAPAAGTSLTDTVTVGGHELTGGTPVSAFDTSTVHTRKPPTPGPDLAIVKNADQDRVRAGDTLTYTLEVSNVGDGPTTGAVTVTDSVPSGLDLVSVDGGSLWACSASGRDITCTYQGGVLDPGDVAPQITVVTTVNDTAVIQVVNTGVVDTPGDTNPTNDRSTVKTPVIKVLPEKVVKPQPTTVLPFTGDRTGQMLPLGLLTVLLGVALTLTGRRKRRTN
jgi:uncharacterized repeat protein (TIGR01451 family)